MLNCKNAKSIKGRPLTSANVIPIVEEKKLWLEQAN